MNENASSNITDGSSTHRRDFLKMLGFGVSAVALAACESPVKKAIPYLNKPEDVEPTIANWYASTYSEGGEYASILVKTREGRPIKIEGNKLSSISKGGLSARVHASLLSLYDNEKLKGAQISGKSAEWIDVDKLVINDLKSIAVKGGQIRIVSNSILSPTTKKVITEFIGKYPNTVHITYDANSLPLNEFVEISNANPTIKEIFEVIKKTLAIDYQINGEYIILKKKQRNTKYRVSGFVSDSTSKETLIGTNIYLKDSKYGITSKSDGSYSMDFKAYIAKNKSVFTCI